VYVVVLGDEGGLEFPEARVYTEEGGVLTDKKLHYGEENPYLIEMRHFVDVAVRDVEPVTKPEEMVYLQATLEAALRSAIEGRPVRVNEILSSP
ncbi:MAG: hypothetical protein DRJ43_05385, partial [Thermoprotei archaeon]